MLQSNVRTVVNCFKLSRHKSAIRVKCIDVFSRNRRNQRRFAHAIQVSACFPTTDSRWALGGHSVGTWCSRGGTTSHYLLARYSTDRGPRAYTQTSRRVFVFILDLSSSSPSFIFFSSSSFLFSPSFSLSTALPFSPSDNSLISLSLFFFFFFILARELKRGFARLTARIYSRRRNE